MKSYNFNTYFYRPTLLDEKTLADLKELTSTYPWFQLAWVLYAKNLKQINSPDYEKVVKEATIRVSNRKMFFSFLNSNKIFLPDSVETENSFLLFDGDKENGANSDSLIDQFLSSNTSKLRRNSETDLSIENKSHDDILERSTAEDDELITETLANIYLQQKNYKKAINAFEKLSLKYPEKSIYFATRIKETEDLKNIN